MAVAARFRKAGARVIDLGAAFRLQDRGTWERVYGQEHTTEAPPTAVPTPAADEPATPPAERLASAPATPVPSAEPAPAPLAAELPRAAAPLAEPPPQPRPRPQFHKRARAHLRRAFVARQQAPQYPPFGWQQFGGQLGTHSTRYGAPYGTTTAWRNPFGGPFNNHPR